MEAHQHALWRSCSCAIVLVPFLLLGRKHFQVGVDLVLVRESAQVFFW